MDRPPVSRLATGLCLLSLVAACAPAARSASSDVGASGGGPAGPATNGQEVRIPGPGSVELFADVYASPGARTTIVLYHQGDGSARGEYGDVIIPRLLSAGYSVVAADLHMGGDIFGPPNRTEAAHPRPDDFGYCEAMPEVKAVRAWASERFSGTRLVTWGSSYTASLVLLDAAADAEGLAAVISFSAAAGPPMEGCRADPAADRLAVPALLVRPANEAAMAIVQRQTELFEAEGHFTWVADPGAHGSSALHPERGGASADATWEALWRFLEMNAPA